MANDRKYRVLTVPAPDAEAEFRGIHRDLGIHAGHDAEAAVEVAADKAGLPDGVSRCVAIPATNWNECDVEEDRRPRYKARRVDAPSDGEPVE